MYMTIVLELLEQRPGISDPLRKQGKLPATVERLAWQLRTSHQDWKETLQRSKPNSDPSQIASEAMELAVRQMEDHLLLAFPPDDQKERSPDEAIVSIRAHTPSE